MRPLNKKILSQFHRIQDIIDNNDRFLISTHINPDGDAISSVLVFYALLQYKKKTVQICIQDVVPEKFNFLSGVEAIQKAEEMDDLFNPEALVILDSADLNRLGCVKDRIKKNHLVINIDHHASNQRFGNVNVVDDSESSAVEIVYQLTRYMKMPTTPEVATLVYTGIICDTGSFRFPNTSERSLEVCAEMVKSGAVPEYIAEKIYYRMSRQTIKGLASALATVEFHYEGRVCCMYLSYEILKEAEPVDTEGFVDYLMAVDETEVEFFMLEKSPGCFRVSLRSKNTLDVNGVARKFGGGGHVRAAGCTINGNVEEVKFRLLVELGVYLDGK